MQELKYISEEDCNKAISQVDKGLSFQKGSINTDEKVYSYHTDALVSEVIKDIADKYKISETFAENYLNMSGATVYSTQNSKIQKETETEFNKSKYKLPSQTGGASSQAAMVIIDHKTGQVLSCCGGLGTKTESRTFNRATQSTRQTGSSSKPLALLVPGIKKRKFTASTIYDDTEKDFKNGSYHPTDYSKALGNITVRRAVESSQNIPFVEMMEQIGPGTSISYLKKMGITSLTKEDKDLPLALGGLKNGISPLEMAGAYSTIANDGKYIEPTFFTKIERNNGKTLMKSKQKTRRVFSKQVAYIIKDILKQPVEGTNGTATYCKIEGVDVAAKTGTTDENYDRWLCGFTPYYTGVTWFGYDKNETVQFNRRNPAGLIWANVMARVHSGLQSAKFENPGFLTTVAVCAETGKCAKTGCPRIYQENFLWFTTPGMCDAHGGNKVKTENDKGKIDLNSLIPNTSKEIDGEEPQRGSTPKPEPSAEPQAEPETKQESKPQETAKPTSKPTATPSEAPPSKAPASSPSPQAQPTPSQPSPKASPPATNTTE